MERLLIWDLPVRLGHWLMVAGFAIAWLTGESEAWHGVHVLAGGTVMAAALFRLIWGVAGSRHARFGDFVRPPRAAWAYLKSLLGRAPQHYTGHNPAGGYAILALLTLAPVAGLTGWLANQAVPAAHALGEIHEGAAALMLAVVAVHVAGVVVGSLRHRENLVRAMFTGMKRGGTGEAASGRHPFAALLLLAWAAAFAWWLAR